MERSTGNDAARLVLVTGASSGIGRATALRLAARGDRLVLVARDEDALGAVAAECRERGAAEAYVLAIDVTDDAAVAAAIEDLTEGAGPVDVLVTCAGVAAYGRTEDVPPEVFEQVVTTNLLGVATLVRHVLPTMRARRTGTIVQVGSLLGRIGVPQMSPYVVSKWGSRALVRQLQIENRDVPGLRICELVPGGVDTGIYEQAANYSDRVGRPPFPVSAERVAAEIERLVDHPRRERHVGPLNRVLVAGFSLLPRTFDLLVGPLFRAAATAPSDDGRREHAGNVL